MPELEFLTQNFFLKDILPLLVKSEKSHQSMQEVTRKKTWNAKAEEGSVTVVNPPQWTGIQ